MKHEIWTIINATPDSFFKDSRATTSEQIIEHSVRAVNEGADVLDVGGMSTRPGYEDVAPQVELQRVSDTIEIIKNHLPNIELSIDTFRSHITTSLYERFGRFTVNDISGGMYDKNMLETVGRLGLPYVMMSQDPTIESMILFFEQQIAKAEKVGIEEIIIDPGFGFGKTVEQNFEILGNLDKLKKFDRKILVGISRKSMIWRTLGVNADQALNGTTALHFELLRKGAHMLRVHDTKEANQIKQLYETYYNNCL